MRQCLHTPPGRSCPRSANPKTAAGCPVSRERPSRMSRLAVHAPSTRAGESTSMRRTAGWRGPRDARLRPRGTRTLSRSRQRDVLGLHREGRARVRQVESRQTCCARISRGARTQPPTGALCRDPVKCSNRPCRPPAAPARRAPPAWGCGVRCRSLGRTRGRRVPARRAVGPVRSGRSREPAPVLPTGQSALGLLGGAFVPCEHAVSRSLLRYGSAYGRLHRRWGLEEGDHH